MHLRVRGRGRVRLVQKDASCLQGPLSFGELRRSGRAASPASIAPRAHIGAAAEKQRPCPRGARRTPKAKRLQPERIHAAEECDGRTELCDASRARHREAGDELTAPTPRAQPMRARAVEKDGCGWRVAKSKAQVCCASAARCAPRAVGGMRLVQAPQHCQRNCGSIFALGGRGARRRAPSWRCLVRTCTAVVSALVAPVVHAPCAPESER